MTMKWRMLAYMMTKTSDNWSIILQIECVFILKVFILKNYEDQYEFIR